MIGHRHAPRTRLWLPRATSLWLGHARRARRARDRQEARDQVARGRARYGHRQVQRRVPRDRDALLVRMARHGRAHGPLDRL